MKVGFLKLSQPPPVKKFYERTHIFQGIKKQKIVIIVLILFLNFLFNRYFGSIVKIRTINGLRQQKFGNFSNVALPSQNRKVK